MSFEKLWLFITTNEEFLSGVATFTQALLWIYLIYLITKGTRTAFFYVAQICFVVFLINTIYLTNKEAIASRIFEKSVAKPVEELKLDVTAGTLSESFWSTAASVGKKLKFV